MGLTLLTPPAAEPIALAEAKRQCNVDTDMTGDDALIESLIVTARRQAENETGLALMTQSWRQTFAAFSGVMELFRAPLVSVQAVRYIDAGDVQQTVSPLAYRMLSSGTVGKITPAYGLTWPSALSTPDAVEVDFTAGYGAAAADVPAEIRQWMLLQIGHWYANREAVVTGPIVATLPFVDGLLAPYRVMRFS